MSTSKNAQTCLGSMNRKARILVGTLFSGENELDLCIKSIEAQQNVEVNHVILRNLPNYEAHQALYELFETTGKEFDLLVKVDADMVFARSDVLYTVAEMFRSNDALDHYCTTVFDWPSQSRIWGLHFFSNRVRWASNDDHLFTDPNPEVVGSRRFDELPTDTWTLHMPQPSVEQCLLFGYHRALKIVQRGRRSKDWRRAITQFSLLDRVASQYLKDPEELRFAILAGATMAFESREAAVVDKTTLVKTLNTRFKEMSFQPTAVLRNFKPKNIFRLRRRIPSIYWPMLVEKLGFGNV